MATNKNQHFVPRCYLKAFTVGGENKAINLFNIDHGRYIPGAPVKHQCSGDYFYGQDEQLENAILSVEGAYETEAKTLVAGCRSLSKRAATVLRAFWVLQYLRTEAASIRSAQMSRQMVDAIGEEAEDFALSIKDAVQLAMGAYVDSFRTTDDLGMCLVRNASGTPFITSDDPSILTNRWHFHRQWHLTRSFGLGSIGLIGLLPLGEELLCVLYDPEKYEIATIDGILDTACDRDVALLNEHQILNCHANLYVRSAGEQSIRLAVAFAQPRRVYPRTEMVYAVRDGGDGDHARYRVVEHKESEPHEDAIIHTRQIHAEPSDWPSFLRWKDHGYFFVPEDTSLRRDSNRQSP